MNKIKVSIKPKFVEFELDGILLRAYADGSLERYCDFVNKHYKAGWNKLSNTIDTHGYIHNKLNGKFYMRHRLIYKAFNQNWDITNTKNQIDHIDQDRLNNSISNLRIATHSQNQQNTKPRKNNKSGHKCIHAKNDRKMNSWFWKIEIDYNGKRFTKSFKAGDGLKPDILPDIPQHIIDIRDRELKRLHGEFACLA